MKNEDKIDEVSSIFRKSRNEDQMIEDKRRRSSIVFEFSHVKQFQNNGSKESIPVNQNSSETFNQRKSGILLKATRENEKRKSKIFSVCFPLILIM